jgi:hypothetical protein
MTRAQPTAMAFEESRLSCAICDSLLPVDISTPFMQSTNILFLRRYTESSSVRLCRPCELIEIITASAPQTLPKSVDNPTDSGRISKSFRCSDKNRRICPDEALPYKVTSCPILSRYHAISEPQRPQPITVTFIFSPPFFLNPSIIAHHYF